MPSFPSNACFTIIRGFNIPQVLLLTVLIPGLPPSSIVCYATEDKTSVGGMDRRQLVTGYRAFLWHTIF